MKRTFIAVLAMTTALGATALHAQTSVNQTTPQPIEADAAAISLSQIRSRAISLTSIPQDTPVAIDLGTLTVPGASTDLTDGVTVKAYSRYINYQGKKIAQVVLTGLEKDGRTEDLPESSYSSQFELDTTFLNPNDDVVIDGDPGAIISALEKLSEAPEVEEQETIVSQSDGNEPQKQEAGQPAQSNDLASSYQTPDAVSVTKESAESTTVSNADCKIRPDYKQMRAFQQNKTITMKDGAIASESECSDSAESFPIQRSYLKCKYDEDTDPEVRLATAQYSLYYVDGVGNAVPIQQEDGSECALDLEKQFPIKEKSCPISLDYDNEMAIPQASLVYLNDNNKEITVRGCQASEEIEAVKMEPTLNGCSIWDDFNKNTSYQQGQYIYKLDGVSYQTGCIDNGTEYAQTVAYTDTAGALLCEAIKDSNNNPIGLQSRIQITVNGLPQYRTPCAGETSGSVTIDSTPDVCTDASLWDHDINAGVSYGQERFYFLEDGNRRWIGACQKSTVVYYHDNVTTGWDPHDGDLFAYPKSTVTITTANGPYKVVNNEVLAGAVQMPYELTGTSTQANGNNIYEGCNKYTGMDEVQQWKRPDETIYPKTIGEADPVGPEYSCTASGGTAVSDWIKDGSVTTSIAMRQTCPSNQAACNPPEYQKRGYQSYKATHVITRDDGLVISSEVGKISSYHFWSGSWYTNQAHTAITSPGASPTNPPASTVVNKVAELGW